MKNKDWALCGYLYCNNGASRLPLEREELCEERTKCVNLDREQVERLKCCDEVIGGACENDTATLVEGSKICDGVCDDWDHLHCADESLCNGFFYGKSCAVNSRKVTTYVPPYAICDNFVDCMTWADYGSDEKECNLESHPEIPRCISGELLRLKNVRRMVPIFNYTRCSSIKISSPKDYNAASTPSRYGIGGGLDNALEFGIPYCQNYIDQTNCTDSSKVAVSCHIKGYGNSTISRTMVCGELRRGFCDNGMDVACVDVDRNCTVHKHQLCDEVENCSNGADEKHPACFDLTEDKCFRNFRSGRELRIPVSWLGDGLDDCTNRLDETWSIVCGLSQMTRRYEINEQCEEVFICSYGTKKFIRLRELCTGVDKCGNENLICQVGRGLSSISTAVSTSGIVKTLKFCHQGLEGLVALRGSACATQEFNPFNENLYGVDKRISVTYPTEKTDCRFIFGEVYVLLSCIGQCKDSICPLQKPVEFFDCPAQHKDRVYTVADKDRLTFVTRRGKYDLYHNDYFVCNNGICMDYDKVCNVWDDCGDGSDEMNCINSFQCKDKQGIIPLSKKCDSNPDCGDLSDECNSDCSKEIINQPFLKVAAWLIGVIAIISNTVVLFENGGSIPKCKSADNLANKLLVILIGVGDSMIGVYLCVIALADSIFFGEEYCTKRFQWLSSWYCSCLGVISTFGSLVSLFSLTALSCLRASKIRKGPLRPDDDISFRAKIVVAGLVSLIAGSAAAIALVTLLPILEDYFVNGLVYDKSIKILTGNMVGKEKHLEIIQSYYGRSKYRTLRWKLIESLIRSMFSEDYENFDEKISRVDFYGNDGVCLFKFFVTRDDPQWVFTIIVLVISIVFFCIITAAYIYINLSTHRSSRDLTKEAGPTAKAVNKRNRKLQRKVAMIILTDFLCWIPFVITCMLHFFEVMDATAYYGVFSIIILPINSVINPFLYSEIMLNVTKKFLNMLLRFCRYLLGILERRASEGQETQMKHQEAIELTDFTKVTLRASTLSIAN